MSDDATTSVTPASNDSFDNDSFEQAEQPEQKEESTEPAAPKAKKPNFRKYKVGNDEVALSDEDIARDYSKWKGADKTFREAAQAKKATEDFMKALQEDPEKILSDKRLPLNKRKLAEKWLLESIEEELNPVDPRDTKLSETERKLKEYEERDAKEAETKQQQEYEKVKEQRKTDISKVLGEAMQSTHLSKDPESAASVLREMALYMRAAKERGEEVTPDELVEHIHNQRFQQFYNLAHQFEGDELIDFLGEEIVKRIRKADLTRLKASRGGNQEQSHKDENWSVSKKEDKAPKKMDGMDAREHVNKILFGK